VEEGRFREDLYYRLRVLPITLPPLRHRRGDVRALLMAFIDTFNREFGKHVREVDPEALALLERHPWPGNVRELRNVVERAVLLSDEETLRPDVLPPDLRRPVDAAAAEASIQLGPEGLDLEALERNLLEEALRRSDGNRTEAGRLLGLSRHQIRNRLHKYGMVD
jgi:transcriptional regulator with PAS, ATPase and Fis domain